MAKRKKKAGCGTVVLGCLGFVVIGFVLFGIGVQFISDTVTESVKEAERIEKELPFGTEERMKHEVSQSVRTDGTTSINQNGTDLEISIVAKEVPFFDLTESDFQMEYTAILKALHRSGFQDFAVVSINSETPMIDKFGNEKLLKVATISFEKSTLDKVNWENFLHINLKAISLDYAFHPVVERSE